ncbi:hypothetical protein BGZ51_005694 [Haplosporangium sp. Z 767]|nr:hypothetical protein BGZ50_008441 [Haplosporangium sp. Z 11]KAF9181051.1 hypothetical protein BGZ51_005694 [Haplosporangium sp. Z 767]
MSKRQTENHFTRDEYDQQSEGESIVQGTFKKASSDELARRPIKALRRLGSRTSSNMSDDSIKSSSPFGSPPLMPASQPSSQSASQPESKRTNPFANVSFGVPSSTTNAPATSTPLFTPVTSTPAFVFTAPSASVKQEDKENTQENTQTPTTVNSAPNPLSNGTFTFNIGTNVTMNLPKQPSLTGSQTRSPEDQEGYERALRGVNQTFLKKIQKEIEHHPTVNLSTLFNQYCDHRKLIRRRYKGIEEPRTIVLPTETKTQDSVRSDSAMANVPVDQGNGPKPVFGLPTSQTGESVPIKTPTAPAGFGFGSSSVKGAVDPPRNPTASGWNFGVPSISTTSTSAATPASMIKSSSFSTPLATSTPISSGSLFSSASSAFSSATSGAGTTPKPFAFLPPKPFASAPPATTVSSDAPKPFVFQVPVSFSANAASTGAGAATEKAEKMVDDTKSKLVETREGEEGEETVFEVRAKLFGFENNEHRDMGVGQFRVNENTETKKRRMIMRRVGTGQIILNSWIIPGMSSKREKNVVTIFAMEGSEPKRFMVRVKEESSAVELANVLEAGHISS